MTRREQIMYFLTWAGGSKHRIDAARKQVDLLFPLLVLETVTDQEWQDLIFELKSYRTLLATTAYRTLTKSRQARNDITGQPLFNSPQIASSLGPPTEEDLGVSLDD